MPECRPALVADRVQGRRNVVQVTLDVAGGFLHGIAAKAHHQRSDVCAVPAAGVVAEAMVALVLAEAVTEKFGGDSVEETARNIKGYLDNIPASLDSIGH